MSTRSPRRRSTVGVRFTLLYTVLFVISGIGLLVLINLLAGGRISETAPVPDQPGRPGEETSLALAQARVHRLESELSDLRAGESGRLLTGSLIALPVMAAVSIVMGRTVARRVLRPLRTITESTRRISAENLHERLAVPGPADEVKNLGDTIDGLLERLETSFAAERRFVANASHELRTPLATMRAAVDVAAAKPEPAPQTVALAGRIRAELDTVDRLLEGLLVLARAQHGALADRTEVDLGELATEAIRARSEEIAARRLTVEVATDDPAPVKGSRTLLARLTANIVDNAIVHNHDGGWIRITTRTATRIAAQNGLDGSELTVETSGSVLEPEHVDRLTRPFQRLATDRTGSDHGSGLGLSIVAAIASAHGGRLELHARAEGGLRVTVGLPTNPVRDSGSEEPT